MAPTLCGRGFLSWGLLAVLAAAAAHGQAGYTTWRCDPAVEGNWFDPSHWDQGVPGPTVAAYVVNDGTARIGGGTAVSQSLTVCSADTSSIVQTGGALTVDEAVRLGAYDRTSGSYFLSGSGQLRADRLVLGSTGYGQFCQTGGGVTVRSLESTWHHSSRYELTGEGVLSAEEMNFARGTVHQTAGLVSVAGALKVADRYELSGTGQLHAARETIGGYGDGVVMDHSGGENVVTEAIYVNAITSHDSGRYRLTGNAVLSAPRMYVDGALQVNGGAGTIGRLVVGEEGFIELASGTITVTESMSLGRWWGKARINFGLPGDGKIVVAGNAVANLSAGTFQRLDCGSIEGREGSLLLLPAGFDPNELRHFQSAGTVHIGGSDLVVEKGKSLVLTGVIEDHLVCRGTITPIEETGLSPMAGLCIGSGGSVHLGTGELRVTNDRSGIDSGTLSVPYRMWVQSDTGTAVFTQTGGEVFTDPDTDDGSLYVGYEKDTGGTYVLSAPGKLKAEIEWVGIQGRGSIVQTGGENEADSLYLGMHGCPDAGASYEMSGGVLRLADDLRVADYRDSHGEFHQTDGVVTVGRWLLIGTNAGEGLYHLEGGTVTSPETNIGPGGLFRHDGGRSTLDEVLVRTGGLARQSDGRSDIGQLTLRAGAAFSQSGGTCTVDDFAIQAGGRWEQSGGTLVAQALDAQGEIVIGGAETDVDIAHFVQSAGGVLVCEVDGDGIGLIEVTATATLRGSWIVRDCGAPYGRFDVLHARRLDEQFDEVVLPDEEWLWGIDRVDGGSTCMLWVEHVPEPITLSLLTGGACWPLLRRRWRRKPYSAPGTPDEAGGRDWDTNGGLT